jgi:hypothetical protein
MSIVYCLNFWDSPNLEGLVPLFISPRKRVAQLYLQALVLSCKLKLKFNYDRRSASQFFFVSSTHLEPMIRFFIRVSQSHVTTDGQSVSSPFWFSCTGERSSSSSNSSSRYIATNGQSASLSWCRAPFGAGDQQLVLIVFLVCKF